MEQILSELEKQLILHKNVENASAMKNYLKGKFEFIGIKQPLRKELSEATIKKVLTLDAKKIWCFSVMLWEKEEREYQYVAIDLLTRFYKKAPKEFIDLYEELILKKSWWDTVDMLAQNMTGIHFSRFPELIEKYTSKWMKSGNIWLQRSAVLFQNKYKQKTNTTLLYNFSEQLADSHEFFIQKAIGWALRNYSETNPESVRDFVNKTKLAPLSRKEALRKIL